ncbi:MAG: TlpA family protein disulfide reductase, partial [Dehalococcoidia bacterium]|nr:TlpA family protein disulfide reductase [Dehalococcoidia bacterium]
RPVLWVGASFLYALGEITPEFTSLPAPTVTVTPTPDVTPEATAAPREYSLAPEFTLNDLDGNEVSLSDFRGSPVLLNFWAISCPPCRAELPYIEQIAENWADRGLVVITVNLDRKTSDVKDFMDNNDLTLLVVMDKENQTARRYGVSGIPATYFIDADGFGLARRVGGYSTVGQIEDDLKQTLYP